MLHQVRADDWAGPGDDIDRAGREADLGGQLGHARAESGVAESNTCRVLSLLGSVAVLRQRRPGPRLQRGGRRVAAHQALARRRTTKSLPDALACANDELALGMLIALRGAGVRVPDDTLVLWVGHVMAAKYAGSPPSASRCVSWACAPLISLTSSSTTRESTSTRSWPPS